jgi:CHAT domain-containing protein
MLKSSPIYIFLFFSCFVFSQQLEEEIYSATVSFIENQNQASFQILNEKAKIVQTQVSTKGEQLAFVFLQCNKAYYLKNKSSFNKAIIAYEDAWKRYSKYQLSGYDIIEFCLKPLGELYTVSKDYANAENTIRLYLSLAKKEGSETQINAAIINLSIVYQSLGKHRDVVNNITDALKSATVNTIQIEKLINIKTDSQIALRQVLTVDEIPKTNTYNYFLKRSQLELQNGDFPAAENNFEQSKKLFFKQEDITARRLAKFYVYESDLFLKVKKKEDVLHSLSMAMKSLLPNFKGDGIPNREDLYSENTFIDIFDLIGDLQTDLEIAIKYYNLSFYVADLLRENISSQETKILNQITNRIRSEKCIELLYEHYLKLKDEGFLISAFQYAENSKASVLKEIVQKKFVLQEHPNDEVLEKEQELLQEQESLTNELIKERMGKSSMVVLNTLAMLLSENNIQLKAVKNEILKKYPPSKGNEISIDKLKARLKQDEVTLVEYFYGKRGLYQFVISAEKASFYRIELSDEVTEDVSNFIGFFDNAASINNDVSNYSTQAFETFQSLNLKNVSSTQNLMIIPDGLLNFIPFEALLTERTETINFSKMPFFLKRKKVVYNSSVEFYLKDYKTQDDKNLLGVFPVFDNTNQQLIHSIEEAKAIENAMNATLLMRDEATKSSFKENSSKYGILHLSTHANSGDYITPASIDFYDEKLYLNELYSLDLNPELVVLSACETGVGKLQKGEGAMSIARGFQYAGTQNILFSLWKINDQSTSMIMESFYKQYRNHASLYTANHDSKLDYLHDRSISNNKKSPYYWAPFMYYGKLTPPEKSNASLLLLGVGILFVVLVFILKRFRVFRKLAIDLGKNNKK